MRILIRLLLIFIFSLSLIACGSEDSAPSDNDVIVDDNDNDENQEEVEDDIDEQVEDDIDEQEEEEIPEEEQEEENDDTNEPPDETSDTVIGDTLSGEASYQQHCASCHGTNGAGTEVFPAVNAILLTEVNEYIQQIADTMPPQNAIAQTGPADCAQICAEDIVAYLRNGLEVHPDDIQVSTSAVQGANTKRLSIDMLRQSISSLFSPSINWEISRNSSGFDSLSTTLGEADYVALTEEIRDPSAIYVKLMEDMAIDLCAQAITHDQSADGSERILTRYVELDNISDTDAINQNLRYLKLKFHADHISTDDTESLVGLQNLFTGVVTAEGENAASGWEAVCIALLLSPEFHLY